MENYARLVMQEDEMYQNLSDEICALPGTFAVFALGLEGPKWWRLVCDYLDRCDDEHSSLQDKRNPLKGSPRKKCSRQTFRGPLRGFVRIRPF